MTDIERLILTNQKVLLLGVSKLLTPHCKGGLDKNNETRTNVLLIDQYHAIEHALANEKN